MKANARKIDRHQTTKSRPAALVGVEADVAIFENLITLDELLVFLKNQYSRHTIYNWVTKGMPKHKIRGGKLLFNKAEVTAWLQRSS